jgi:tetratricopeptide (TPR) repeat protein
VHFRVGLLLVALGCNLAACNPGASVPPPVETSLADTETAIVEQLTGLLAAAREEPRSAQARATLGMAYEMSGRLGAAHESYAQAAGLDPSEPRWSYFEAVTQSALGDLEGALVTLDRVLAIDDAYVGTQLFRGQWLLDLGRVEQAGEAYTRASQLAPNQPAGWIGLAKVHLRSGRPAEASQILDDWLRKAPNHPILNQLAGQAYRELGDMQKARAALALAKPTDQLLWRDEWLNERVKYKAGFGAEMMRATSLMNGGKTADAVELMEQLRKQRPDDRQLLNNLSVAYRGLRQPERAFEVLRDGLERHPQYHPFHLNISADYQRMGDIDQALWHLARVIEISPTFAPGWERIGSIRLSQRELPEALEAFENAARYKPDSPTYPFYSGIILAQMKRWAEARERMQRALEIRPGQASVLVALGQVQAELGHFEDSRASLDLAKSLSPDNRHLGAAYKLLAEREAGGR